VVVVLTIAGATADGGVGRLATAAGDIVVVNAEAYDEARRGRRRDAYIVCLYIILGCYRGGEGDGESACERVAQCSTLSLGRSDGSDDEMGRKTEDPRLLSMALATYLRHLVHAAQAQSQRAPGDIL